MNRRALLVSTGAALAAVAGGCLGGGVGPENDPDKRQYTDGDGDDEQGDDDTADSVIGSWYLNVRYLEAQSPEDVTPITPSDDPILADAEPYQTLFDEAVDGDDLYADYYTRDEAEIDEITEIWTELPTKDDGAPRIDHDGEVLIGDWGSLG